jgi:hypothetical protein
MLGYNDIITNMFSVITHPYNTCSRDLASFGLVGLSAPSST